MTICRAFGDKWLSYLLARQHGLAFAESCLSADPGTPRLRRTRWLVGREAARRLQLEGYFPDRHRCAAGRDARTRQLRAAGISGDPAHFARFKGESTGIGIPLFHTLHGEKHSLELMFSRQHAARCVRGLTTSSASVHALSNPTSRQPPSRSGPNATACSAGLAGAVRSTSSASSTVTASSRSTSSMAGTVRLQPNAPCRFDEVSPRHRFLYRHEVPPSRWATEPAKRACAQLVSRAPYLVC